MEVKTDVDLSWGAKVKVLAELLGQMQVTDRSGEALTSDVGYETWVSLTEKARSADKNVFLIGNGASASMASHLSADLAKNAALLTMTFTDLSLVTALGNDDGYDTVFSSPIRWRGRPGDMLVAISSSGGSPNILKACEAAREKEVTIVTLSGFKADNPLRSLGDLNFYVAADTYGNAESSHAAILHHWADVLMAP